MITCECCDLRPAVGVVRVDGGLVFLCGGCLDDAVALGLVEVEGGDAA